jgi:hypothetical protein
MGRGCPTVFEMDAIKLIIAGDVEWVCRIYP